MGTVHGLEYGPGQYDYDQHSYGTADARNDSRRGGYARYSCDDANFARIDFQGRQNNYDSTQQTAGAGNHSCRRGCACHRRQPGEGG